MSDTRAQSMPCSVNICMQLIKRKHVPVSACVCGERLVSPLCYRDQHLDGHGRTPPHALIHLATTERRDVGYYRGRLPCLAYIVETRAISRRMTVPSGDGSIDTSRHPATYDFFSCTTSMDNVTGLVSALASGRRKCHICHE